MGQRPQVVAELGNRCAEPDEALAVGAGHQTNADPRSDRRVECERRLQEASRETKTEKSRGGDDRAKRKDGGEESDRSVERESGVNKHTKVSNPFEIATDAKSNTGDSRDSVQTVIRLT